MSGPRLTLISSLAALVLSACLARDPSLAARGGPDPAGSQPAPACAPAASSATVEAPRFDAVAAWAEFEELMRLGYAYFQRPGVDGPAILAHFAPEARASVSARQFIDLLKVIARHFADPHLQIGPSSDQDPSLVPTSSDLYAAYRTGECVILDVRAGSDASAQGIRPGARVLLIEGLAPQAAVERLLQRPLAASSPLAIDYALNVALTGVRRHERRLEVRDGGGAKTLTLRPTAEQADRVKQSPRLVVEQRGPLGLIRINNSLGQYELIPEFRTALEGLKNATAIVIDLRNTPSGGNTSVARGIMGHFIQQERPYQVHVIPFDERQHGTPRKFVEYVLPIAPYASQRVFVIGGRWTGSMGEGLMIGFESLGATSVQLSRLVPAWTAPTPAPAV